MKKFLAILIMCLGFAVNTEAQVQYYRTTAFAIKTKTNGYWSAWSDWEKSDMTITIDLDRDIITIYSPEIQRLKVISIGTPPRDDSGRQVAFNCWDQVDRLNCKVRLRIENNGNSQIYVDWADVSIVYNVVRTSLLYGNTPYYNNYSYPVFYYHRMHPRPPRHRPQPMRRPPTRHRR